jgi:hypothetical protein
MEDLLRIVLGEKITGGRRFLWGTHQIALADDNGGGTV